MDVIAAWLMFLTILWAFLVAAGGGKAGITER